MPHENLTGLPGSMRRNLPHHAREIHRAAYFSAEEQYGEESRAHPVAWSDFEDEYEKNANGDRMEK